MACGRVLGAALPAISNGHVGDISKIERSPHSMAPLRVLLSQSEFDQGPTNMRRVSGDSCDAVKFVARAPQGARANADA